MVRAYAACGRRAHNAKASADEWGRALACAYAPAGWDILSRAPFLLKWPKLVGHAFCRVLIKSFLAFANDPWSKIVKIPDFGI
jgi:hypothetical protein